MSADTLCWTDIPVTNLDRAIKFYSAVLGKEVRRLSEGRMEYGLLPHEGQNASGCLVVRGDSGGVDNRPSANAPLIYLWVEGSLDEALENARIKGGVVVGASQKIGGQRVPTVTLD